MKPPSQRTAAPRAKHRGVPPRAARGGTLIGIFIGLVIGLGMAAGVAFWLMRNNPAFQAQNNVRDAAKDAAKGARADATDKPRFDFYKILPGAEEAKVQPAERKAERPDRVVADQAKAQQAPKPPERGTEAQAPPAQAAAPASAPGPAAAAAAKAPPEKVASIEPPKPPGKSGERFWLQAGSFTAEPDAENLKARLALAGWEASVQQGILPDKAVRYRVRLGPYDNTDELNRVKGELGKRGFDAAVIKY